MGSGIARAMGAPKLRCFVRVPCVVYISSQDFADQLEMPPRLASVYFRMRGGARRSRALISKTVALTVGHEFEFAG